MTRLHACGEAILVSALLSGCYTVGPVERADTLAPGHWQLGVEGGAQGSIQAQPKDGGTSVASPLLSVSGHFGVARGIEVAGRIGPDMLEAEAKFQLTPPGGTIVSLAPTIGGGANYAIAASGTYFTPLFGAELPVLIGVPIGPHQLVFNVAVGDEAFLLPEALYPKTRAVNELLLGGGVGFAIAIRGKYQLMPELGVAGIPANTSFREATVGTMPGSPIVVQAGIAFLYGR